MNPKERLKKHFLQSEKQQRVSNENEKNQLLERQVKEIVVKTLDKVVKKDPRFEYKLHGTGSYYDGVKVGHPDEFDFLVELSTLSSPDAMKYVPTEVPGFVQICPSSRETIELWKDCLTLPSDLKNSKATQALFHNFKGDSSPFTDSRRLPDEVLNEMLQPISEDEFLLQTERNYYEDALEDLLDLDIDAIFPSHFSESDIDDIFPKVLKQCNASSTSGREIPILAPTLLQTTFKTHFDEVMFEIDLPDKWEHGGHDRPNYSGCRRHGPATMIQLVYTNKNEEIKLNVDITLGIAVPFPVSFKKQLNMNVFDKIPHCSELNHILRQVMQHGPNIHLIPLYSKMLVQTKRFNDKFSFRISCSCIEKKILDFWQEDSGPKKCMRIMKIIRDQYFSEGKRKTYRGKKKSKKLNRKLSSSQLDGKVTEQQKRKCPQTKKKEMPVTEYLERIHTADNKWSREMQRNEKILQNNTLIIPNMHDDTKQAKLQTTGIKTEYLTKQNGLQFEPVFIRMHTQEETDDIDATINMELKKQGDIPRKKLQDTKTAGRENQLYQRYTSADQEGIASETTDITEVEEQRTKQEAFKKFQQTRFKYQTKDISDMVSEPGSGEYYGPRAYLASIEIKTYILRLIAHNWDPHEWTDEKVCEYTDSFFKSYHTWLLNRQMMKSFFFDTFVCSPISEEQRLKALEKYNQYQEDVNNIMEQMV